MKLNFGKRIFMFFHWLLSLIGCVLAGMFCVVPDTVYKLFNMVYDRISKRTFDTIGIILAAVYVLLTIGVACLIFTGSRKRENRGFITVDNSETGKTRIATSAVDQMIRQAMSGVDGISEVKSAITNFDDSISIAINVTIAKNAHVPTVTSNIQRAVRGYIEQNCGVAVREVSVSVKAVDGNNAAKGNTASAPVINIKPVEPIEATSAVVQEPAIVPSTVEAPQADAVAPGAVVVEDDAASECRIETVSTITDENAGSTDR